MSTPMATPDAPEVSAAGEADARPSAAGHVVLRHTTRSIRWRRRHGWVGLGLALGLLVLLAASLVIGEYRVSALDAWHTLWGEAPAARTEFFVLERRLPRALVALSVGACLAMAGAIFQRVTRNPLASPDIIGVNAGAALGAVIVVVNSGGQLAASAGALVGAVAAASLLLAASARGGLRGPRMVLLGVAVSAFCGGLVDHLLNRSFVASAVTAQAWVVGSLQGRSWPELAPVAWTLVAALPVLAVLGPRLRLLGLGDELAGGLGLRVTRVRAASLVLATVLVAVAVSVTGPIAFVALVAPHIAGRLVSDPGLAISAMIGGALLLGADLVAQHALVVPVPVGVVTAVLGGVFFLVLMLQAGVRRRG